MGIVRCAPGRAHDERQPAAAIPDTSHIEQPVPPIKQIFALGSRQPSLSCASCSSTSGQPVLRHVRRNRSRRIDPRIEDRRQRFCRLESG